MMPLSSPLNVSSQRQARRPVALALSLGTLQQNLWTAPGPCILDQSGLGDKSSLQHFWEPNQDPRQHQLPPLWLA